MKCQSCSSLATVHLTDIVNGHKKEVHLCQTCAEQQQFLKQAFAGEWPPARVRWRFESEFGSDYDFSKNVRQE